MKVLRSTVPPAVLLQDPLYNQRNPHQAWLLGLSVIASLPLLRGQAQSALLERELDNLTVVLWGSCLLLGSLLALLGEFWPGRVWTALVFERSGLGLVGGAAAVYGTVTWSSVGDNQSLAALLPWALMAAIPAGAAVAVHGAYRIPDHTPRELTGRIVVGVLVGLLAGGFAGMVWHADARASGVVYVISIQAAYSGACIWRCAQITVRLRWLRMIAAHYPPTPAATGEG